MLFKRSTAGLRTSTRLMGEETSLSICLRITSANSAAAKDGTAKPRFLFSLPTHRAAVHYLYRKPHMAYYELRAKRMSILQVRYRCFRRRRDRTAEGLLLSIREARRKIYRVDAVSADELPFYDARLTEFSVHRCAKLPFETEDAIESDE